MQNIEQALLLGLPGFHADNMVTPEISGLENAQCLQGLYDTGVRYAAGNTSIPWMTPEEPNVGMYDPYYPDILIVPRHPTNLFYNVATPEQWVSEYNHLYHPYFGRDLSYEEILHVESSIALQYMLSYDNNPLMFHQSNLATYDSPTYGVGTTIGDWTQAVIDKYTQILALPVVSEDLRTLAARMLARMEYDDCGARVSRSAGSAGEMITISVSNGCTVPVTGVARPEVGEVEAYGGQYITWVPMGPGETVSFAP
ncbi:MAG: hypothetical protein ACOC1F_06940, partial [Myxococcota bacterium]